MQKLTIFYLLILCNIRHSQDFDKLANAVIDKDGILVLTGKLDNRKSEFIQYERKI